MIAMMVVSHEEVIQQLVTPWFLGTLCVHQLPWQSLYHDRESIHFLSGPDEYLMKFFPVPLFFIFSIAAR